MAPGFKDQRLIALNAQSRLFLWALSAGSPSMRVTRPLVLKPGGFQLCLSVLHIPLSSLGFAFLVSVHVSGTLRLSSCCCWVRLELKSPGAFLLFV